MSLLKVLDAGPYTSVQDRGRFGGQRYGLGTAGAMDILALAHTNVLVGLPVGAAALEIGPLPARFAVADGQMRVAIAGAERGLWVNGRPAQAGETMVLCEGDVLSFGAARKGVFSYLAFEGGIRAAPVFGSLSVHARSGIGSPLARALLAGDGLEVGDATPHVMEHALSRPASAGGPIRVIPGPQADHFTAEAMAAFFSAEWRISPTSDRMGYRLDGPVLTHSRGHNIVSDGVAPGAIQVPGRGQPLVLLADRGTTGGYPKIATVISVDLGRMAQTAVGGAVRFVAISVDEAENEVRGQALMMGDLHHHLRALGGGDFSPEFLLGANLAGAVTDALSHDFPEES